MGSLSGQLPPLATIRLSNQMLDESIQELAARALERIAAAGTAEELEAVRVEMLGRKGGALAEISKGMGKLSPDERKRIGQVLNQAKQEIETALDGRKSVFEEDEIGRASWRAS